MGREDRGTACRTWRAAGVYYGGGPPWSRRANEDANAAGESLPPRAHLGRIGGELRGLLGERDWLGRTQRGNNNAYGQDNEIGWLDWKLDKGRRGLLDFTRSLIALRRGHPVLRRRQFFYGRPIQGSQVKDLAWFRPDGKEMTEEDWRDPQARCIGLRLAGDAIDEVDARGERIVDDTFLLLLNAHHGRCRSRSRPTGPA
jgi:pullulanase/glycogen debranching enzyme